MCSLREKQGGVEAQAAALDNTFKHNPEFILRRVRTIKQHQSVP